MRIICNILIAILTIPTVTFAKDKFDAAYGSIYLKADHVTYNANKDSILAEGHIYIIMDNYILYADKMHYDVEKDLLFAEGNIQIKDQENRVMKGSRAVFTDKLKMGVIEDLILKLGENSILVSRLANRLSANRATLYKSAFTPCEIQCGKSPIWQVNAKVTDINFDKQRISYKNLFFEVYGIPIMFLPYFSHPTPNAPAESGLMVPELKNNNLFQPFYFRPKSNLDITIGPSIGKKYNLLEFELRHLLEHGEYMVTGSYGNPSYSTEQRNKVTKNSRPDRFHIFANGNFHQGNLHYGFDIKKTSDKSYLKNYQDIYASYLPSSIYLNKVKTSDYFAMEGYYFQELRSEEVKNSIPIIFPNIRTLNIFNLNEEETIYITLKNNTLTYNEKSERQFFRSVLDAQITKELQLNSGHLFSFTVSNRADLYLASYLDNKKVEQERVWYRNIPEIGSKWSLPMVMSLNNMASIKVEPIASIILGAKYNKRFDKFNIIDAPKYEVDNDNLFNPNRFSGIDFHEYGSRLNYGLNSSILSNLIYIDLLLGQALYKDNVIKKNNSEYVGNASIDLANIFEGFYRFRKDNKLRSIIDEIGIVSNFGKISTGASYVGLNKISRYYSEEDFKVQGNNIKQLQFDIDYNLSPNITIGGDIRFDVSGRRKKHKVINRTIRMTYTKDCVRISGKLFDDYTEDSLRGLKKVRSKTFSVGLKVLNM